MSSKLDGIAMSFAHVAEEEFEKDSLLDKSLTKETNHKNESDEQRSSELRPTKPNSGPIYLRVNYHLNSYTIALVPPVSYNALYEKVRNKVNLSKGIPTPSEDNRTGSKFSVSGIHDNRASSGVQSTQLDKIKISYALDNGTTSYVESDKEAREAADPNRRHFSDGIFVS